MSVFVMECLLLKYGYKFRNVHYKTNQKVKHELIKSKKLTQKHKVGSRKVGKCLTIEKRIQLKCIEYDEVGFRLKFDGNRLVSTLRSDSLRYCVSGIKQSKGRDLL